MLLCSCDYVPEQVKHDWYVAGPDADAHVLITAHQVKQFFPRAGSEVTPVHAAEDFGWKDYAPLVFR
jgi:hypothetical protein